ncbi:MAG: hypothetical protein CSA33_05910 [Desulfobulbus propionicus]|nr:MAG: hypothetical protein CSA33_05910 [Desulfobulbus propionicus]
MVNCDVCGVNLSKTPGKGHKKRSKFDIVFEKVVEHIDAEIKQCPNCEATVKGLFPEDMPGSLIYGNGIKAFAIHLIISQMVALNRVQKQIAAMIGSIIYSFEGTTLKLLHRKGGKEGIEGLNIIPRYGGMIIHDC